MPTNYLYANALTSEAVAANNRGDNVGNTTTLQKVFHQDDVHTSVSAEAIRFAYRYRFQLENSDLVNRSFNSGTGKIEYKDDKISYWNDPKSNLIYIDDDLMGFMDAESAKKEKEDQLTEEVEQETTKSKKKGKPKGKVTKRQSPLAVGRSVSLRPYRGEISFNCKSGEKEKGKLSLYNAEMHTTEYQYFIGLNLGDVVKKEHISYLLDAVIDPPQVAGNHSRFAYDFSPASIVFRLTNAHSSRIQNCFEHDEENQTFTVQKLIRRVKSQDIPAKELIIAGDIADTKEGEILKKLGVSVLDGVYAAAAEVRNRIAQLSDEYKLLAPKKEDDK